MADTHRTHTHKPCSVSGCSNVDVTTRGMCPKHYQRWRLHGDPLAVTRAEPRAPGSGGYTALGYLTKQTGKSGTAECKRVYEHVERAEDALGKALPSGAVVHHVDCNPKNNIGSNLVICPSQKYHKLLHSRVRALDACGNAGWKKCSLCGEHDDPSRMYVHKETGCAVHRACRNKAKANRKAAKAVNG